MEIRKRKVESDHKTWLDSSTKKKKQSIDNKNSNKLYLSSNVVRYILLLTARLIAVRVNHIHDCDETYNYWEPSHFLLYGSGFQTWEYSPLYAIRSYFYLWLYMLPGATILPLFPMSKVTIFYLTRCMMAPVSALCETYLCDAISKTFTRKIANYYLLITLFAPGMFHSCIAFLPSSFGQYLVCVAVASWLLDFHPTFIFSTAFNAIVGWPFTSAISLPFALDVFRKKPLYFVFWSVVFGFLIMAPTMLVDSFYYGKPVLASANIVLYNLFTSHGPNIYGTEPFSYYVINLLLNYNIIFVVCIFAWLPILALVWPCSRNVGNQSLGKQVLCLSSLYLWWAIFGLQAHKEERFMYPIYPLITLVASLALNNVGHIVAELLPRLRRLFDVACYTLFGVFVLMSLSRIVALNTGYAASMRVYDRLAHFDTAHQSDKSLVLCLAKEWHRFPSNFFIPSHMRVEFVPSEFRGQLPKHYQQSSQLIPTEMNDHNQEEPSRYISLSKCDLLIDSDYDQYHGRDFPYSRDNTSWAVLYSLPFLDNSRSSSLLRAFYVPYMSTQYCTYVDYNILINRNLTLHHTQ